MVLGVLAFVGYVAAAEAPRPAAVAGTFYPDDPAKLRAAVQAYLDSAVPALPERPVALVTPHAGYVYSGQIAADAWCQVAGRDYDVVVVLGVNHRDGAFEGISVYTGPGYRTPLGTAACDRTLAASLAEADKRFAYRARADAKEHSVEVQVPFVQTVLPGVPIVAVVVGSRDSGLLHEFGRVLAKALEGRRGLIVASSDLSHYPAYDDAVASDRAVVAAIARMDPDLVQATVAKEMERGRSGLVTCACGQGPIIVALVAARELGATRASVLSCANSGNTALGDRSRCVGYTALALTEVARPDDTAALDQRDADPAGGPVAPNDRLTLLDFARRTIAQYLASDTTPLFRDGSPALRRLQGVFVTLRKNGDLRGCIGHMDDDLPLGQAVGAMALQAAFNDNRFSPLQAEELEQVKIEISVLTPFREITGPEEVVVGRDGVVLEKAARSAVFLPQVATEQGWNREELLTNLSLKAGLPADAWRRGARLSVFQAEVFGERDESVR
jgi:AmmeMemoRadiSam system protein B/AmmeMemoRadiSam system protein A